MAKYKKNIIWGVSWTIITIMLSILNQRLKYSLTEGYSWGADIQIWFGGLVIGLVSAICFLLIDYLFIKRKAENSYILFILRIILAVLIILVVSFIQKKFF